MSTSDYYKDGLNYTELKRMKTLEENSEYISAQSRGMSLGRQYVNLDSAIDKEKIISLHHLSDDHLYMLNRSVKEEIQKRQKNS